MSTVMKWSMGVAAVVRIGLLWCLIHPAQYFVHGSACDDFFCGLDDGKELLKNPTESTESCEYCAPGWFSSKHAVGATCASAVECSRLLCDIGEIYDFTDQRCKRCEQLQSMCALNAAMKTWNALKMNGWCHAPFHIIQDAENDGHWWVLCVCQRVL